MNSKYEFNHKYFDIIDNEEKAYWLGFIWCDGYVCRRVRNGKVSEYQIKISLSEKDEDHLVKLKKALESNHPIKKYDMGKQSFKSTYKETRLMISNKYMGRILYDSYGLIPYRSSISKLINQLPSHLERHFIRGVFDAEGSTSMYFHKIRENWRPSLKMNFTISTYSELIEFIQNHFIKHGIKENKVKTSKRHPGGDGECVSLRYSGAEQVPKILNYLYNEAEVYLERKYSKYLNIKTSIKERKGENIAL